LRKRSGTTTTSSRPTPLKTAFSAPSSTGRIACRCAGVRLHPDGHEVDGVFTLEEFRGRGLARLVVQALIDACGHEELYMGFDPATDQLLQNVRVCPHPRGPAAEDDPGAVPVLLRRDGRVQTVCPMRRGGRWWVNGVGCRQHTG